MKMKSIIVFSILLFISCGQTKSNDAKGIFEKNAMLKEVTQGVNVDTIFTFDNCKLGKIPSGWSQYYTGKSDTTDWKVIDDGGSNVLAQLSEEDVSGHFNEVVFNGIEVKNVELNVKIKGFKGERDQGGGFVWRFRDADNHYIVRANPLEDNVVLYKMEDGKRTDLPLINKGRTYGVDVDPLGSGWNKLKLVVIDNLFTVYLNEKEIFQVKDETFSNAGKIGLWTKADAVTYFDDFKVTHLK